MLLSWRVHNFVVIGWICYEQEHFKISLNFEFDRNIVSGTGARRRKGSQQSTKVGQRSPWNLRSTRPSSNMASALVQIMSTRPRWIKLICVIIICFSIRRVSSDSHLSDKAKIAFSDNRMSCFHNLCWFESHQFYLFVSGCYIWLHPQKIFDMPQCIALMLFTFWFSGELSHDASMLMLWVWLLFRATLLYAWCICSSYG